MAVLERIRAVIARIPRGRVITYGQAAAAAGFPRGARLTVAALRSEGRLPWHRVVASGGRIALPGEEGREQRLRLEIEGVTFHRGKVRMDRHGWRPSPRTGGYSPRSRRRRPSARAKPAPPASGK